jgi:integrase/recombinase XerD
MNVKKISKFKEWMAARNMAQSTIDTYSFFMEKFSGYIKEDTCRTSKDHIQQFIFDIPKERSNSYQNQAINAIKLYFEVIENKKFSNIILPRPIKDQYIPEILTEDEICRVIFNTINLKHQFILFSIYDNALRRQELLNLKLQDIRTKNLSANEKPHIIIRDTKNHKSRIIPLSEKFIELYRAYYNQYHPFIYLFEGSVRDKYSASSIRNILNDSLRREGINKRVRIHDLRHAAISHCLIHNTNIYHLKEWSGHSTIKTIERTYAHVSFNHLQINKPELNKPIEYYPLRKCS